MMVLSLIALGLGLATAVYLVVALVSPERFE
ncbi:potassium-transporting ATPase subunit F [Galactobacter caseinivorans]|uniref:Potassium-transporting ATPase subunit F n=1 Tax=Galactobacter caseinivorans TaxID=2676123 RepID=A0A496PFB5_9MICC|nr:potassium-transporting ATPase subunit F [Galactobacter caseinivorans]